MRYADGSLYEGQWSRDVRHGQGTLSLPDGQKWIAEFKNDEIVADKVRIEFPDSSVYVG